MLELYFKDGILEKVVDCSEVALALRVDGRKKGDDEFKSRISLGERWRILYNRFLGRKIGDAEMSEYVARWKDWHERSDRRYWNSKANLYKNYEYVGMDFYMKDCADENQC